jgi:coenzyme F420-0:L-glutamate ligase/coenzyme F420-1:gamma-L-glutamate ligase
LELYAVKTKIVEIGDDLVKVILESLESQMLQLEDDDILVLASKVVSYVEGRLVKLDKIKPSERAASLAKEYCLKPEFADLILRESDKVYGGVNRAVLTLKNGVLAPNAGIDNKNAPNGFIILWPSDPKKTARAIRGEIRKRTGKQVGVLIVDSGLVPLRIGTNGLALAVAGFKPIRDYRKSKDLFGKEIVITRQAIADDLASAAHLMMGEAKESTPLVLVRGAPVEFDEGAYDAGEMTMQPDECIFMSTLLGKRRRSQKA